MLNFFTKPVEADTVPHLSPANQARLAAINEQCRHDEELFNKDSGALTQFLRAHLGFVPPMMQTNHGVWVRVNELRLRDPQLRKLETVQRESKMQRDASWKARADLLLELGLIR